MFAKTETGVAEMASNSEWVFDRPQIAPACLNVSEEVFLKFFPFGGDRGRAQKM